METKFAGNYLLSALIEANTGCLPPRAEAVGMPSGTILHLAGMPLSHVYFPVTALISVQRQLDKGGVVEMGSVGNEGLVGFGACLGAPGESTPQMVVSLGGTAYRLTLDAVRNALRRSAAAQRLLLRHARTQLALTGHVGVCNCCHSVQERICRWLLFAHARFPGGALDVTQDALAGMIGVRRESVTGVMTRLRQLGIVHTDRGHLDIIDRRALEGLACECYALMRDELAGLIADLRPAPAVRPGLPDCDRGRRRLPRAITLASTYLPGRPS